MFKLQKSYIFRVLSVVVLIASANFNAVAQDVPHVKAAFSQDSIMIGDQIDLSITIDKDVAQVIVLPEITTAATGGKIEVLGDPKIDTLKLDGRKIILQAKYKITSFESGNYSFRQFPVLYVDKNITDTLFTDSLRLIVNTYQIDTSTYKISDIKARLDDPFSLDELEYYIKDIFSSVYTYVGLLVALLIAVAIWYVRRRRRKNVYVRPSEPPHVTAIRDLELIAGKKLWENGRFKEYYTELTDVLRQYLQGRYGVNAKEMTSQEIFDAVAPLDIKGREIEKLKELLLLSDFVKFAKVVPSQDECRTSYDNVYYFVEETKLMPLTSEVAAEKKDITNIK
ncbi:MAG: LPXTG cell wall anchor domain-containing protein [Rikenellaceae bacterium]